MKVLLIIYIFIFSSTIIAQNVVMPEEIIDEPERAIFDTKVPEFPGGIDSLKRYMKKNFIDLIKPLKRDTIIVQFIIKTDGSIENISLVKGELKENEKKLLFDVLQNMPSWSGTRTNVKWTLPLFVFKDEIDYQSFLYEKALNKLSYNYNFPLSIKECVFAVENAYLNDTLNYVFYDNQIKLYSLICSTLKNSNPISYNKPDYKSVATHAAIFRFMTDTIAIQMNDSTTIYHLPFQYNHDDYAGKEDWSNMFITKLMKTHKGNCHSLPLLYKLIAEEMGEKAWLSLAPNHFYIKLHNKEHGWYNTELTSATFPTDAYIKASGYIHTDAIKNGMYMDTLSLKESIAVCMVDLAQGYQRKFPDTYDPTFVLQCCNRALTAFPDYINALLLKVEMMYRIYQENDNKKQEDYDDIIQLLSRIHNLGYRKMPEEMYLKWLMSLKDTK